MNAMQKLKSLAIITVSSAGFFTGLCFYKNDEKFYRNYLMPFVHKFDPEFTHELGIIVNKYNLLPKNSYKDPASLNVTVFGKNFSNPVGIAAGFDKQAEAVHGLHNMGFGFVEVGSVTPKPQPGNPKPRVFRLTEDFAVINRYGFNSDGHEIVYNRLESLKDSKFSGIIGVNLGKNKTSPNAIDDYVQGIEKFGGLADYLVINISSPNTPGLRSMQDKQMLQDLLSTILKARDKLEESKRPPILLKLAPDLNSEERADIAEVINRQDFRVDGLIVSNTTIARPTSLRSGKYIQEAGGLSGKPLAEDSTQMIAEMYRLTNGITIIGVGGIFSGKDAYEKIKSGASLVQIYTALIYDGPPCASKIKRELAELIKQDGYKNITEAIGKNVK